MIGIPVVLGQILTYLGTLLGLAQFIYGRAVKVAQETTDFFIQDKVIGIQGTVDNTGYGNFAIKTLIDTLTASLAADTTSILTAIGTPQQTGDPVTLPTTPPTGYGNVSPDAIATAVWNFLGFDSGHQALQLLEEAAAYPDQITFWNGTMPLHEFAGWEVVPISQWDTPLQPEDVLLTLDWSTVLATDNNAVDWLNRIWTSDHFIDWGGGVPGVGDANGNDYLVPWLNTPTFQILRDQALGLGKTIVPPVWPGLAGVTLGSPVAIDTGVTITADMDGVLIDITAAPLKQGYFTFDTAISYRNVGALAFVSDNGQEEFPQTLGFTSAVYCPKTMAHAAGVVFRSSADLTGTITPFTLL